MKSEINNKPNSSIKRQHCTPTHTEKRALSYKISANKQNRNHFTHTHAQTVTQMSSIHKNMSNLSFTFVAHAICVRWLVLSLESLDRPWVLLFWAGNSHTIPWKWYTTQIQMHHKHCQIQKPNKIRIYVPKIDVFCVPKRVESSNFVDFQWIFRKFSGF